MEQELLANVRTCLSSAELVYQRGDYTSATMLYFKTVFVALDILILRKLKRTPKDHAERFRILEKEFPEQYALLDKYYPVYRSTYSVTIDQDTGQEIRNYVTRIIAQIGI